MSLKKKRINEIKTLRSKLKKTHRITCESLEKILYEPFKVMVLLE